MALIQAVTVAEYLNFRHAANALGIAQSSVSARVKALEKDLGILLFERHARGVRLTEAGRHFIEHVAIGIEQLNHAVKTAGALASGKQGCLRLGLHLPPLDGFVANLLVRYQEHHPGIGIDIMEGRSADILRLIREGKIDIAFVAGTPLAEDCHSRLLWSEAAMVALPASHPLVEASSLSWSDLAAETFLVRYGGTGPQAHDHVARRIVERGFHPKIIRWDVGRETLFHMVAKGWGVTITTESTARMSFPDVVSRAISDETELVGFHAVWSPYNQSRSLHNLLDLANRMQRELAQ